MFRNIFWNIGKTAVGNVPVDGTLEAPNVPIILHFANVPVMYRVFMYRYMYLYRYRPGLNIVEAASTYMRT
jgi:hypothetical protein